MKKIQLDQSTFDDFAHDDSVGICVRCHTEVFGVEPDARGYVCDICEKPTIYGFAELVLMGMIEITEDQADDNIIPG
jgi:hypothetical protein